MAEPRTRSAKVLNKAPAAVQITAEQLMREAWERQEGDVKAPVQRIADMEELMEYRMRKRTEFENSIRQKRHAMSIWLRYVIQLKCVERRKRSLRGSKVGVRDVTASKDKISGEKSRAVGAIQV